MFRKKILGEAPAFRIATNDLPSTPAARDGLKNLDRSDKWKPALHEAILPSTQEAVSDATTPPKSLTRVQSQRCLSGDRRQRHVLRDWASGQPNHNLLANRGITQLIVDFRASSFEEIASFFFDHPAPNDEECDSSQEWYWQESPELVIEAHQAIAFLTDILERGSELLADR